MNIKLFKIKRTCFECSLQDFGCKIPLKSMLNG